jgi:ribosome-associated protein
VVRTEKKSSKKKPSGKMPARIKTAERKTASKKSVGKISPAAKRFQLSEEAKAAIAAAQSKKALDLVLLDLRDIASFADYFLICSGTSTPQNQAISNEIEKKLREAGRKVAHIEGYSRAEWILLDYSDLVVHIFSPASRQFYSLERLWRDVPRIEIPES